MMGRIVQMPGDIHSEIQSLLPWYLLGGLDEVERARVHAHVNRCAECQAELRDEPRLAAAIAGLPVGASRDAGHGWGQISRAIAQAPPRRPPFTAWVARLMTERTEAFPPRARAPWLGWVLAGQFGLILVLSLGLWRTSQPARYHTLGSAPAEAAGNIVVIFRPQTAEKDFRAILRSNDARLVDGPTVTDTYLLHVSAAERAKVLARLRRQPEVALAEPVDGAP